MYERVKSFLLVKLSLFEFLGGLSIISNSAFSYEKAIEGTMSVPKSMKMIYIELRGRGIWLKIKNMNGKTSAML